MIKRTIYILSAITFFSVVSKADSIFSRNGWGIYNLNQTGREAGMGVLGIGSADTAMVGSLNPAIWAGINVSRFSSGIAISRFSSQDHTTSDVSDEFTLQYVSLGISLKPGLTFGLRFFPQTRMDYRVYNLKTLPSDNSYQYEEIYLGKGGISVATALLAMRLSPKIWIGGGLDVVFCNVLTLWRLNFIEGGSSSGSFTTYDPLDNEFRLTDKTIGVRPRIGLYGKITENSSVGIFAATDLSMTVTEDFEYWNSDSTSSVKRKMNFPATAGFGYYFPLAENLHGEFDFLWTGWSKKNQEIFNSSRYTQSQFFGFGVEMDPQKEQYLPVAKRMSYRAGVNYRNLYYQVPAGVQVPEYSVNFGIGFPLKNKTGSLDINLSLGKRGTLSNNNAEELFFSLGFYINTGEKWFERKRKY